MKLKGTVVVILSLLLLYMPVAPAATNPAAGQMMTSKGTAAINGVTAPEVTSIFAGDRIATAKQSLTSLAFPGGDAVVIPELSKASLGTSDGHVFITLEEGSLSVLNKTATPIEIRAGGARIAAANGASALYEVTLHGNALRVVARNGAAHVETANRTGDVPAGMALNATFAPAPQQPAGGNGFVLSTVDWALIAAGAAAGLGVGIYEATKSSSSSPS